MNDSVISSHYTPSFQRDSESSKKIKEKISLINKKLGKINRGSSESSKNTESQISNEQSNQNFVNAFNS